MSYSRLFDILPYQQERFNKKIAFAQKNNGTYRTYSTDEAIGLIEQMCVKLMDLGLKKGDCLGIMSIVGSAMWNFVDIAAQKLGIIVVPLHGSIVDRQLVYILEETNMTCCFVDNDDSAMKINKLKAIPHIFCFQTSSTFPAWDSNLRAINEAEKVKIQAIQAQINESDLATIIYTSGTTGEPKGVMLSHYNIVSNIKSIISLIPINYTHTVLSFLPLSHVFERTVTFFYMAVGASIYYAESVDKLPQNLLEVKPHFFTSVPRLLEKMYENILASVKKLNPIAQKVFYWALNIGEQYDERLKFSAFYQIQKFFADLLVFRQWRKVLGGRVQGVIVGAAALQPHLGRLFSAAKIPVREGYGLTETSPVIAMNRFEPGGVQFGTVGIVIPSVTVKIHPLEDSVHPDMGEIWVKGPNVMLGYFKKPEATAQAFDQEGWFKTGDVGHFLNKRFLQITDRQKDMFKTSHGKYVSPMALETALKNSPLVNQCLVIGQSKPFVSVLIVPNFEELKAWCDANKVHWTAPQYMAIHPKVEKKMYEEIQNVNNQFENTEKIKKILLLHEEWTPENNLLTPTMKTRRNVIIEKYQKDIDKLYELK